MYKNLLCSIFFAAVLLLYGGTVHAAEKEFPLIENADAVVFVNRVNEVLHGEDSPVVLTPPTYDNAKSDLMTPLYTSHTPSGVTVDLYMTPDRAYVHRAAANTEVIDVQGLNEAIAVIAAVALASGMTHDEMSELFLWKPAEEVYAPDELKWVTPETTFKVSRGYCNARQQMMGSDYLRVGPFVTMSIYAVHQ